MLTNQPRAIAGRSRYEWGTQEEEGEYKHHAGCQAIYTFSEMVFFLWKKAGTNPRNTRLGCSFLGSLAALPFFSAVFLKDVSDLERLHLNIFSHSKPSGGKGREPESPCRNCRRTWHSLRAFSKSKIMTEKMSVPVFLTIISFLLYSIFKSWGLVWQNKCLLSIHTLIKEDKPGLQDAVPWGILVTWQTL